MSSRVGARRRLTRMRFVAGALALLGGLEGGCAPRVEPRFAQASGVAGRLFVRGRYREAAEAWLAASRASVSARDRDEAVYRAAGAYERAGDAARAEALLLGLGRGQGERAGRASFDHARLVLERDPAGGEALRLEALRRHPDHGVAPKALHDHLLAVGERDGSEQALRRCRELAQELSATELDEALGYECATLDEQRGDHASALRGYLTTAERHPYPRGALWDDALTGAARCEERLGRATAAIALFERLLGEREHSSGVGSYERSRYAEARFHVAELYRDALGDPARARVEFERVATEHTTSRLGDDALFEAARLAAREGNATEACRLMRSLAGSYPDSRFNGCANEVCPGSPVAKRSCPEAQGTKF